MMTMEEVIEKERYLAVICCDMATAYHTDKGTINSKEEKFRERA